MPDGAGYHERRDPEAGSSEPATSVAGASRGGRRHGSQPPKKAHSHGYRQRPNRRRGTDGEGEASQDHACDPEDGARLFAGPHRTVKVVMLITRGLNGK